MACVQTQGVAQPAKRGINKQQAAQILKQPTTKRDHGFPIFMKWNLDIGNTFGKLEIALTIRSRMTGMNRKRDLSIIMMGAQKPSILLSFANSILALVGYICFLFFLKHLSLFIQRPDLAITSSTVVKLMIVCAVTLFALPFVMGFSAIALGGAIFAVIGIVMLVWLLLCLVTFIRYANLVGYVARAIPK